jgi:hypothetical protein
LSTSHTNRDYIEKDAALILIQLDKKAAKNYPLNTALIMFCKLHLIYYPDDWEDLMKLVFTKMPENSFTEIFFMDDHWQHKSTYYSY